ncbi:MAG: AAA family ATPase [Atopobiaceae bacterium]|nr:AAA family ATPase [Atopobiaceae bacterium]
MYVDKSGLIGLVNSVIRTPQRLVCVSRPRRFGKSFAAKILCAYYDNSCDSHALFNDLAIARDSSYETHINKYVVIYVDTTEIIGAAGIEQLVSHIKERVTAELLEALPTLKAETNFMPTLSNAGAGVADVVYFPRQGSPYPALVVELKWNQSSQSAIAQIRDRHHPEALKGFDGEVLLASISYDKNAKAGRREHHCVIERTRVS